MFEARKPKGLAEICEENGRVIDIQPRSDNKTEVTVRSDEGEDKVYVVPYGARLAVKKDDYIYAGGNITSGPLNPHDILRLNGVEGVYPVSYTHLRRGICNGIWKRRRESGYEGNRK